MCETALDPKLRSRWRAIGPHAILDRYPAVFILAERRVNHTVFRCYAIMNDGEVFFPDRAAFPNPAQFQSGVIPLGHNRHAAGLAIEAIDEMRTRTVTEMQPHAADEARQRIAFGRMANQARRFVDHQQIGVFMNDVEQLFHILAQSGS